MEQRYVLRLRSRRIRGTPYGVSEIWRLADNTKLYEEWADPRGNSTPSDAARALRLLEAAPDDQAEAIIAAIHDDRSRAAAKLIAESFDDLGLTQGERDALGIG